MEKNSYKQPDKTNNARAIYYIANMDCPMEEALIRKKLATVPGITGLDFNLMNRTVTVDHNLPSSKPIEDALIAIDMAPEKFEEENQIMPEEEIKIPWKKLIIACALAALSELCELVHTYRPLDTGNFPVMEIAALLLAIAAILLAGLTTYKKGWLAISNFNLNINALMAVAVTGAVLIGQFPEAAMVMVLFNISEAIEAKALAKTRGAIKELMDLTPDTATVLGPDGQWREENVKNIAVGSKIRVKPGEKFALDGIIITGQSTLNQAPITGESMPVSKKMGELVYAGSINETGSLEYKTTALASDSTVARIIKAVESAQASKAPVQRFIDIFAKYYTPAIFIIALLYAVIPPLFFHSSWTSCIYTSLVLLVIGCPCALVISTPVTIVSSMAAAAKSGIIIKGGVFLEQGRLLKCIALDKTGTITYGKPELTDHICLDKQDEQRILTIAHSLANRSDHPVSLAINQWANEQKIPILPVSDFAALPGEGIIGIIEDQKWFLGKYKQKELSHQITELESEGKTVVYLSGPDGIKAIFAVADTIRKTSIAAISELKKLGINTVMLTGDNQYTAEAIAQLIHVDEVKSNLLPEEKLSVIKGLKSKYKIVGMVGDGINDAPALAEANIGFAMAKEGTDTAIETADIALMDDDLRKVPRFINLSKSACIILAENIALALGIKIVFFVLTLCGYVSMWMAVFADVGAALIVVINGLRMMRK